MEEKITPPAISSCTKLKIYENFISNSNFSIFKWNKIEYEIVAFLKFCIIFCGIFERKNIWDSENCCGMKQQPND
jgi:hypothetical protein